MDSSFATVRRLGGPVDDSMLMTVNIQSSTLADSLELTCKTEQLIDTRYIGAVLDYDFAMVANTIKKTKKTANRKERWVVTALPDVEDLLRKLISFPNTTTGLTGAMSIMNGVAIQINKTPRFYFTDFNITPIKDTPTVLDIVSRLFSWSNQVPTMKINVFIRGDELWVVQRGHELGTYTIDKDSNGNPEINQQKLYTLNSSSATDGTPKPGSIPLNWDTATMYLSGSWSGPGGSHITVENGLLTHETVVTDKETTDTSYSYNRTPTSGYLTAKTTNVTGEDYTKTISVSRSYGDTSASFGYMSCETISTSETKNGNTTTSEQQTYYTPRGANAYSVAVYKDGQFVSGQTVVGRPPSGAESLMTANDSKVPRPEKVVAALPINDYSLPFTDAGLIDSVTAEIERLDGLTQKNISLVVYDAHMCNLTESYIYDGAEYYLETNKVDSTPTKTIQTVGLVSYI